MRGNSNFIQLFIRFKKVFFNSLKGSSKIYRQDTDYIFNFYFVSSTHLFEENEKERDDFLIEFPTPEVPQCQKFQLLFFGLVIPSLRFVYIILKNISHWTEHNFLVIVMYL